MNPQEDQRQTQPYAQPNPDAAAGEPVAVQGANSSGGPQVVYMARPLEPIKQEVSPEARQKHEASRKRFPDLNLSENEYVISAIKRHPIGIFTTWTAVVIVIAVLLALAAVLAKLSSTSDMGGSSVPVAVLAIPVFLVSAVTVLFGFISTIVYQGNRFYLTNESVIQRIQTSLFSKREQTISLGNIEDASYTQNGIIQELLGYGLIRLSTPGNETTYRFQYASNPQKQIALLNDAVESFKNGQTHSARLR